MDSPAQPEERLVVIKLHREHIIQAKEILHIMRSEEVCSLRGLGRKKELLHQVIPLLKLQIPLLNRALQNPVIQSATSGLHNCCVQQLCCVIRRNEGKHVEGDGRTCHLVSFQCTALHWYSLLSVQMRTDTRGIHSTRMPFDFLKYPNLPLTLALQSGTTQGVQQMVSLFAPKHNVVLGNSIIKTISCKWLIEQLEIYSRVRFPRTLHSS